MHGVGGSAGVGILLVGGISGGAAAALALLLFAGASALTMALASGGFGYALALGPAARTVEPSFPCSPPQPAVRRLVRNGGAGRLSQSS